jgi:signal transduction histidine kinase
VTGRRSWVAAVVQWRNWPVLVKVGAVLVVPVVGAMVLGVLRVQADIALSGSYGEVERLAALRGELVPTLSLIQRERNIAVQEPGAAPQTFLQQAQSTDVVVASLDKLVRETPNLGAAADAGYEAMKRAVGGFTDLRRRVLAGEDSTVMLAGYNTITGAILDFDRSLVGRFPDQELTGTSMALYDLQVAREQASQQQALVLIGIRRGELTTVEREWLIEADVRLADMISDMHSVAPPDVWQSYLINVAGKDVSTRQDLVRVARAEPQQASTQKGRGRPVLPFGASEWNSTSDTTIGLMTQVARTAATRLQTASASLQDLTGNRAGTQSVLLLTMVLLAGAIGGIVGRYLLKSLGTLRKTALDVAASRLPAAVESIRAGRKASIDPVPVRTTEEIGQLARAFDTVHSQAVRSAEEEANLRGNLRNILVNLSRRSQGLVERQLKLMEQLEQKENDPDQLASLFKLDHLATRMRRNNENLVVLSGAELGRRFTDHVPLSAVLRAAVSEVEHYERAVVRPAPRVQILGYAAGDLVRSIAELVENATAFSPPDAQVIIQAGHREDGSVFIEILDDGIGMADAELAEANSKVAAGGGIDVPVSRQMGLFVVGSLASRQGFRVSFTRRGADEDGLVAAVVVPAELIAVPESSASEPAKKRPWFAGAGEGGPADDPEATKRVRISDVFGVDGTGLHWPVGTDSGVGQIQPVSGPADSVASVLADDLTVRTAAVPEPAPADDVVVAETDGGAEAAVEQSGGGQIQPVDDGESPAAGRRDRAGAGSLSGYLESVGIFVKLPELPVASSPASILFRSQDDAVPVPKHEDNGFAWLGASAPAGPPAQRAAASAVRQAPQQSGGELPKRVPQAQLHAGARRTSRTAVPRRPASAERARGFLSSFQAGVRLSKAAEQGGDMGEEKP